MSFIWYHGTTETNHELIQESGYLQEGTYLTPHFDSALQMGGPIIYTIDFNTDPKDAYWEYITKDPIPLSDIKSIRRVSVELLYFDKAKHRIENYCETCLGHGELNYPEDGHFLLPAGAAFKNPNREIVICPDCNGFGSIDERIKVWGK